MQLPTVIAALPWLRRLWRFLPPPLRVPLLVIGAIVWLFRRGADDPPTQGTTTDEAPNRPAPGRGRQ